MREYGGGRDSGDRTADSWFRPSENRFRTQSEYQDPEEGSEEGHGYEPEANETVFPDSGGYAGLSPSRPAMVEPYPEALSGSPPGGAPAPGTDPAPTEYQAWNATPQDHEPGAYPGVAASAEVPLPPEESARRASDHYYWSADPGSQDRQDSTNESWSRDLPAFGAEEQNRPPGGENHADRWASGPSSGGTADWGTPTPFTGAWSTDPLSGNATSSSSLAPESDELGDTRAPRSSERPWEPDTSAGGWGTDAPYSTGWGNWSADGGDPARPDATPASNAWPSDAAAASWTPSRSSEWGRTTVPGDGSRPVDQGPSSSPVPGEPWSTGSSSVPAIDPWRQESVQGEGHRDWRPRPEESGSEAPRPWEPAAAEEPRPWEPTGDYGDAWPAPKTSQPWSDGYDDELSPSPPTTQESPGGLGTGSGNTWAFDRNDPRLPDVVREAERRRQESAQQPPQSSDWGGAGTPAAGETSSSVPPSDDPLAAIADMQSRAREREDEQGPDYFSDRRGPSADWQDPEAGAPQRFDASAPRSTSSDPFPAAAPHEPGGAQGTVSDYDVGGAYGEAWNNSGAAPWREQGDYAAHGHPSADPGPDGGATRMFAPSAFDNDRGPTVPTGVPSDVDSVPAYGRQFEGAAAGDQTWAQHEARPEPRDVYEEPEYDEPEYDDGFSPADYGMPEGSARSRRRRTDVVEDFPGFDDRPLGDESDDGYPGYDSVDYLADTDRGAMVTLWLGVASLIPGIGLITAMVALLVTGPRSKRAIRASRGQLDGLGMITTGTVFAVVGIVVTVLSALLLAVL